MLFDSIHVENYRSIRDSTRLPLGQITIITGRNNSGKSALLRSVYSLQSGALTEQSDVRIGAGAIRVSMGIAGSLPSPDNSHRLIGHSAIGGQLTLSYPGGNLVLHRLEGQDITVPFFSGNEPDNLIYPVFNERRQYTFRQPTSGANRRQVSPNGISVVARIGQLAGSTIPEAKKFQDLCQDVLGIRFDVYDVEQGGNRQVGVQVSLDREIPIEAMGTGLGSTLSLLVAMSIARDKLILVEEPETDLHPMALKKLLDEIALSAESNQFIISTHSSVVLTRLGSLENTVIIAAASDGALPPSSSFRVVESIEERVDVLQQLGYELADLYISEGWLIFEESSAQQVCREFLIPWFAPALARLQLLGMKSISRVEPIFQDYHDMLLYSHVEPMYRMRAWVIVDGDEIGFKTVDQLRGSYPSWDPRHFLHWSAPAFEMFYPERFQCQVRTALGTEDRAKKRERKAALLQNVLEWMRGDPVSARREFECSAAGVIAKLREVEAHFLSQSLDGPGK